MTLHEKLLRVAKGYSQVVSRPLSAVSRQFFNDGKKLTAIEQGATLTCVRYEQAMRDFASCWPADHAWPSGVDWPSDVPRRRWRLGPHSHQTVWVRFLFLSSRLARWVWVGSPPILSPTTGHLFGHVGFTSSGSSNSQAKRPELFIPWHARAVTG